MNKLGFQKVSDADIDFNNKLHCVDELAKRWWYAMPAWPPANYDYQKALNLAGLRLVNADKFASEPEIMLQRRKVHPVDTYEGIFKDSDGETYDFRPRSSMPSLANF